MKSTDLRAKARAIFGPANPEPMPNQPNGAKALQQRANARPIPTYKVGGVVKKADGGKAPLRLTPAEKKMGDALMMKRKGKEVMAAQKDMEAQKDMQRRKKQEAADKLLGIRMKTGGKVQTSADTAKKLATEMGGMKKGGKAKDGLAVMIAIGKVKKPVKKAKGGSAKKESERRIAQDIVDRDRADIDKGMRGSYVYKTSSGEIPMYPKEFGKLSNSEKAAYKDALTREYRRGDNPTMAREAGIDPALQGKAFTREEGDATRKRLLERYGVKKPVKKAVGGAGKTRKGMAPIKKAQGGAAKVRKGMMSETGDIKQVVKPKKGLGGM